MEAEERDVVVIGAGVAGLTAAARLAAAGADVVVLEARDRVGGRLLTEDVGGLELELGGQWIAPYQDAVRAVIADLGLELFRALSRRRRRRGRRGQGRHARPPRRARPRPRGRDRRARGRHGASSTRTRRGSTRARTSSTRCPTRRGCGEAIGDEGAREALGFVATGFMTKPSHSFSLLQAAWLLSSAGEVRNLLDPDLVLDARVVGGAQRIALGLAERLGDRVRLGAPVRDVAWTGGGVDVHVPGGEISARRLIVAIPPNLMGDDPLRPAAPRVAHAGRAGDLAGLADQGPGRLRRAVLAGGRAQRHRLRAGRAGLARSTTTRRRAARPASSSASSPAGAAEAATRLREPERRRARARLARPLPRDRARSSPSTTASATGTATSGRAAPTRRRSASAVSRASAPTCAARSARSPSRGPTSPVSGRCTWTARSGSGHGAADLVSPAARASAARTRRRPSAPTVASPIVCAGARRRSVGEPGLKSWKPPSSSWSGRCEWPNTTASASGNRAPHPRAAARWPARRRGPSRSAPPPASTTRAPGSRRRTSGPSTLPWMAWTGGPSDSRSSSTSSATRSPACRIASAARSRSHARLRQRPVRRGACGCR